MIVKSLERINAFLNSRSVLFIETLACAEVLLIGYLDYATGAEFYFSIFYFLPIMLFAWHGSGRIAGNLLFATFAALVWLAAELVSDGRYENLLVPYWNAVMMWGIFVTVFLLFSLIRKDRAKLVEANAQLNVLNDQKNQLLGWAAHDLRSPLAIIQLYADMLREKAGSLPAEKEKEFIDRMEKTSRFMLELLEGTLDISMIEAGKLTLEPVMGDYGDFVGQVAGMQRMVAERKNVGVNVRIPDGLPPLRFDACRMEQVLNNLIGNAVKFSLPGTSVEVDVLAEDNRVVTRIEDHGSGVPENELEKLFQPFYRASVKPTAGEKSTGLGLAIAKKIVESHGGEIGVESVIGRGTTFFFSLPKRGKAGEGSA